MKLALEIISREIEQRKLANSIPHLRVKEVEEELRSLLKAYYVLIQEHKKEK